MHLIGINFVRKSRKQSTNNSVYREGASWQRRLRAHNNWKDPAFQISPMQFDSDWEETLNDIDELIQSELGCSLTRLTAHDGTHLCDKLELQENNTQSQTGTNAISMESLKWNMSDETLQQSQEPTTAMNTKLLNNNSEENVEVQIVDLRDVYDKKTQTKKGSKRLEYRLENSEVTVVVRASVEITKICAYVQRCARAAIRTHDIRGPVKLEVSVLESEKKRQVISVDLGSVCKKQDGDNFYWLERADVAERNKWEVTIKIEFVSGLTASVTSRPFQVTTKVHYKRICADHSSVCKVQNLSCKITKQQSHLALDTHNDVEDTFLESSEIKKDHLRHDRAAMEGDVDYNELRRDVLYFNLAEIEGCLSQNSSRGKSEDGAGIVLSALNQKRIILQPNTILQRHMLASYYGHKPQVSCIVEQPELPALLKLAGKRSMLVSDQQKKTKRYKSVEVHNYSWACGYCFFERRKKSTIRAHLTQEVCQKPRLQRLMSKKLRSLSATERRSSSEKHKPASWKRSRSF